MNLLDQMADTIAELRARAEKAEAELAAAKLEQEGDHWALAAMAREITTYEDALATARALAFAEAIEAITEAFEVDQDIAAIDVLKARAKLPPTLRSVPVETLAKVRGHIAEAMIMSVNDLLASQNLRAALSLLPEVETG